MPAEIWQQQKKANQLNKIKLKYVHTKRDSFQSFVFANQKKIQNEIMRRLMSTRGIII